MPKHEQTVSADFHCELDRANEFIIEKCPEIVNRKGVIVQYDNITLHCTRRTLEKIN